MRYGSYANDDGQPEQKWHATVQNDNAIESQRLALRHARAMAAVLRAAKAWRRAQIDSWDAHNRMMDAVARLVAVEKEVSRG